MTPRTPNSRHRRALAALTRLEAAITPRALDGNPRALHAIDKIHRHRATLLGITKPDTNPTRPTT